MIERLEFHDRFKNVKRVYIEVSIELNNQFPETAFKWFYDEIEFWINRPGLNKVVFLLDDELYDLLKLETQGCDRTELYIEDDDESLYFRGVLIDRIKK